MNQRRLLLLFVVTTIISTLIALVLAVFLIRQSEPVRVILEAPTAQAVTSTSQPTLIPTPTPQWVGITGAQGVKGGTVPDIIIPYKTWLLKWSCLGPTSPGLMGMTISIVDSVSKKAIDASAVKASCVELDTSGTVIEHYAGEVDIVINTWGSFRIDIYGLSSTYVGS